MIRLSLFLFILLVVPALYGHAQQNNGEGNPLSPSGPITTTTTPLDNAAPFVIREIVITGNRKTKESIILRELPFKTGDHFQLNQLVSKFEYARRQLMNISLFHEVVVAIKSFDGYNVDVMVDVKERWYIFPVPYFKIVDRNLNQWIVQHNASFSRVNYGLKLMYNNFSGHNDKLNAWVMSGYTKQVSLSYDRMYFDRKMKWGGKFGFAVGKNREINYKTVMNKELFFKDTSRFIRSFFKSNLEITYRRATKTRHRFGFGYTDELLEDTVIKLNPEYFGNGVKRVRFPEIYYNMDYLDLDYNPYPLKGFRASVGIGKRGLTKSMNVWSLSVSTGTYLQLFPKTYFSFTADGTIRLPFKQPFYNSRLMGYGDVYMQGFEYYVVDGVAGGDVKTTFTRELFTFHLPVPRTRKQSVTKVPFRIFGKIYGNTGYVYNPEPGNNFLANRMLYSGGFGIDILTLYDVNIKLEYSFNQIGQNALYLHRNSNF